MGVFELNEITNWEHEHNIIAQRITDVGSYLQTMIEESDSGITYIGRGARGLATSSDGWLLTKITEAGSTTTIQKAIGVWDNRSTVTYG